MPTPTVLLAGPAPKADAWRRECAAWPLHGDLTACSTQQALDAALASHPHALVVDLGGLRIPDTALCVSAAREPGGANRFACGDTPALARPVLLVALELARERQRRSQGPELGSLADHLPFDVWARDAEDRVVYANPVARRHWRMETGARLEDGDAPPETMAVWRNNNARARQGEVVTGVVPYNVDGRDGVFFNIIAPVHVAGQRTGTVGVNVDITQQTRAEKRADALQDLITRLFDSNVLAVGIREVRGEDLVHVANNSCVASILGHTVEALRGKSETQLGTPAHLVKRALERFRVASHAGKPVPFEMSFPQATGTRTFVGRLAALPADHGEPERYVFFGEDVTELRALQSQLMRAERLASLGTLAASIGHEIKNPATTLSLGLHEALEVLQSHPGPLPLADRAHVRDLTRVAVIGLDRIVDLVKDLMDLARPDTPVLEPVDLSAVVGSVLALTAGRVRGHVLVTRVDEPVPPVMGQAVRLAQVLLNLIINALQALAGKGTVVVSTTSVGTDRVRVDVADDGPGVPADVRDRLFQPFVTAEPGPHHTGLGLYISRQIVDALGGTLQLLPRPGGGTIARLELKSAPRA